MMKPLFQFSIALFLFLCIGADYPQKNSGKTQTITTNAALISLCGSPGPRAILELMDTTKQIAPLLTTLGNYKMAVTTSNSRAQQFFNQGIILYYGFNHFEAYRSFKEAARLDPQFAMAFWGQALSLGPNINLPMDPADSKTVYQAIQKAITLNNGLPAREKILIDAVANRYTETAPSDRKPLDEAYAKALSAAAKKFPDDPDINSLYAEALMDLHPWDFFKKGEPQPWTAEPVSVIAGVLQKHPMHPGANHLNIHILEASTNPGQATASADRLQTLVPGAGHLVHMPSHIYIRTGRYIDGIIANEKAVKVDKDYIEQCNVQGVYPLLYYPHNYHFLWACAQMSGQKTKSMNVANELVKSVKTDLMNQKDFVGLQHLYSSPWYTMIRFGMWQDIMLIPEPPDSLLYVKGVWHYARGMALVKTDRTQEAQGELEKLQAIVAQPIMKELTIGGFNSFEKVLGISSLVTEAEIRSRQGNFEEAKRLLNAAIEIEDNLLYQEPPDWFLPVRQVLGSILLKANKAEEAEAAFKKDLTIYPENGWSLFGLAKALEAQNKKKEAAQVRKQFKKAFRESDLAITSATF
jgi:tetratricopeptide (TPR) repeat protein